MTPETAGTAEQAWTWDTVEPIARGLHTPDYRELLGLREYARGFRPRISNEIQVQYTREAETLSMAQHDALLTVVSFDYWRLTPQQRQERQQTLQATSLDTVPHGGRHRGADPVTNADILTALKADAQRQLDLDEAIQNEPLRQAWANSRHALRHGLGPDANYDQIKLLRDSGLASTLGYYVRHAERPTGRSSVPVYPADSLPGNTTVEQATARPAPGRFKRIARHLLWMVGTLSV